VLYGVKSSCPTCHKNNHHLTKEKLNERLANRGIVFVDNVYHNTKTVGTFRCSKNHEWNTLPRTVLAGYGCPKCSSNAPLTKETVEQRLKKYNIILNGDYVSNTTKTHFKCHVGHEWVAKAGHVIDGYSGCPTCSQFGFRTSLPGSLYILHFEILGYIKFGITNYFEKRYQKLSKQGKCVLLYKVDFENGMDARFLETAIKKQFKGFITASKEELPDGYTETLPESMKDELLAILKAA
jgi:hypothetical protein